MARGRNGVVSPAVAGRRDQLDKGPQAVKMKSASIKELRHRINLLDNIF